MNESQKSAEKKTSQIQIIVAIAAILVPILVTIGLKIFEKESRELSLFFTDPVTILSNNTALDDDIKLFYDSLRVNNIASFKIILINSGNKYLSKDDFIDGAIEFTISPQSQQETKNPIPCILDVVITDDARQRNSQLKFSEDGKSGKVEYLPSLLNPTDKIELEIFIPNTKTIEIDYKGKIKEGTINGLIPYTDLLKQTKFRTFITSINGMLGGKWISIILFVIFVASMALGTFGFGAASADSYEELKIGEKFVFFTLALETLLFLTILIFITIY